MRSFKNTDVCDDTRREWFLTPLMYGLVLALTALHAKAGDFQVEHGSNQIGRRCLFAGRQRCSSVQ